MCIYGGGTRENLDFRSKERSRKIGHGTLGLVVLVGMVLVKVVLDVVPDGSGCGPRCGSALNLGSEIKRL